MEHALAHSSDSYSPAMVLNLYVDAVFFALQLNQRGLASRVTMDVRQAFLNKSKNEQFHFGWKPSEIIRNPQINFQTAALRETLHVPTQCRGYPALIQQRRMQQIRRGTKLTAHLLYGLFDLARLLGKLRGVACRVLHKLRQLQSQYD